MRRPLIFDKYGQRRLLLEAICLQEGAHAHAPGTQPGAQFLQIRGKISGRVGTKNLLVASDSFLPTHKLFSMTNQQPLLGAL